MPTITERLKHSWNAFLGRDPTPKYVDIGPAYSYRPDRPKRTLMRDKSVVTAIYNRIAVDCAAIDIEHVRIDKAHNNRFTEVIQSNLNECLTLDANLDQTGKALKRDIVMSMFDEGCIAVVPVETTINPNVSGSYDISSMRTGKILEWYPEHVKVRVYNEKSGHQEEIILPKKMVAIIENPFYSVMNEPNSTLQRLIHKLNLLDYVDEQSSSGKLNLIVQLPYVIKSTQRREQAEQRRKDIEAQLSSSKFGIAYTDGTERIMQLNRPIENNIWTEVKDLTAMLYNQLGITEEILNGTANEQTMINYYNNTIDPILSAIADEMQRKFLTKTARTQGQAIRYFRDPFRLVPVDKLSELTDKFTRNEVASPNEFRAIIGWKPSENPQADELRNRNINQSKDGVAPPRTDDTEQYGYDDYDSLQGEFQNG